MFEILFGKNRRKQPHVGGHEGVAAAEPVRAEAEARDEEAADVHLGAKRHEAEREHKRERRHKDKAPVPHPRPAPPCARERGRDKGSRHGKTYKRNKQHQIIPPAICPIKSVTGPPKRPSATFAAVKKTIGINISRLASFRFVPA